jgi:hypothetical protein
VHPLSGDGNVYSSQFHQPIPASEWGPGYWKVPENAQLVFQTGYAIYYIDKEGKIFNAYNNILSDYYSKTIVPPSAKKVFVLLNGLVCHLDKDGYLYDTPKNKKLIYAVPNSDNKIAEYPKLPDNVRFIFQFIDFRDFQSYNYILYFIDTDGNVIDARTLEPVKNLKSQLVNVPADCLYAFPVKSQDGINVMYFNKNGKLYNKEDKKEDPGYFIPPAAKFIFPGWGNILYVAPDKKENYSNKIALQQNGGVYEALTQSAWGTSVKKDGKDVFSPYTVPADTLNVFSSENILFYHAKNGNVYTVADKQQVKGASVPTNARFITSSKVGSGVTYVGADNNIYDALDGAMISAAYDKKSEFEGVFIKAKKSTYKFTVTNKDGKIEEKEIGISTGGTPKTVPPDAKDFCGAVLYKTPTFIYTKGNQLYNAMIPDSPSPVFDKKNFPKGWNIVVPKYVRMVFYSENLSDVGTDFYYVSLIDGCVYDLVWGIRMHVDGVPYYIPNHAKWVIALDSGKLLYVADIPEVKK